MYGYIYETTNKVNGKKYIGQSRGQFKNWYLGSGVILKKAIEKYGKENFVVKIIASANSKKELNKLEIDMINKKHAIESKIYYNLHEGGIGGDTFSGKKHTSHTRKVMSKKKKGKPSPHKGKHFRSPTEKEKKQKCLSAPNREEIIVNGKRYPSFNSASKDLNIRIGRPSINFYRKRGYNIIIPDDKEF